MSGKICKCGHTKTDHFDCIDRYDAQRNRPYKEYVAKGFGKCQKCKCDYFKK